MDAPPAPPRPRRVPNRLRACVRSPRRPGGPVPRRGRRRPVGRPGVAESFARAAWNAPRPSGPSTSRTRSSNTPPRRASPTLSYTLVRFVVVRYGRQRDSAGGFYGRYSRLRRMATKISFGRAARRYAMLVGLWGLPGEFLVPTYDQDLVWHAHLSVPSVYEKEMRTATYRDAIAHDDSVNDRTPGAKLEVRGRRTMELWRTHYPVSAWDEPYARRGAMWRGYAPDWYWTCQFPRPIPPSRAPGPVRRAAPGTKEPPPPSSPQTSSTLPRPETSISPRGETKSRAGYACSRGQCRRLSDELSTRACSTSR